MKAVGFTVELETSDDGTTMTVVVKGKEGAQLTVGASVKALKMAAQQIVLAAGEEEDGG